MPRTWGGGVRDGDKWDGYGLGLADPIHPRLGEILSDTIAERPVRNLRGADNGDGARAASGFRTVGGGRRVCGWSLWMDYYL